MTYIKHNGQWKRTTGVEIKRHSSELFLTPQVPDMPHGITLTENQIDTGSYIVRTKRMPASPGTKLYLKQVNNGNSNQRARWAFDINTNSAKSLFMSGVTVVSGTNGGSITILGMKDGQQVAVLWRAYYPGTQATHTDHMHLTADISAFDTIRIYTESYSPGTTELTLDGIAFGY